ncbi:hypothetical protein PV11_03254 [Exophiala sideris]|uniref:DNA ligase n=1 Tax=Exophiala sideris TaxID=1016849 RepID=A0A0D1ZLN9_9EURO|nr:hypothetical protein PV11_03254 [Exophiala sideris]
MSDDERMDVDSGDGGQPSRADIERQLNEEYPNRPHNKHRALPFHTLIRDLFNPLLDNRTKKAGGAVINRRKVGPNGGSSASPSELRRAIIERYIARWRRDVGQDFFPAFRLIIPDKDRERGVYGLKEKILGKLLVRVMKIDKNSEDGFNLLNWKIPGGGNNASRSAGDFALRCHEIISKRPMRTEYGDMDIDQVNELLDQLSAAPREEHQLPILAEFYKRMNADELQWVIRIILRTMKVGATEKTFFHIWHPDAESLFNISSNLRRVCWELWDPAKRLDSDETGVALMQCFQPQLAQFSQEPLKRVVQKVQSPEDNEFWIEEKLDGERMQLHMVSDNNTVGGRRFQFWSRKGKDYTYLYGNGLYADNAALTPFIKDCFPDKVENIILDGEMITWDPKERATVAFGTLKSAALAEQRNPYAEGQRPLFRVFDILLVNDRPLTRHTLDDRRRALVASVNSEPERLEIHGYQIATTVEEVEESLREVIAQASEGLVLKNPRSAYKLDDRNGDWQKVKPEYMMDGGESLDCLIIGGFYGSGKRGGNISSFMCGLRLAPTGQSQSQRQSQSQSQATEPFRKFVSFFKVGGGFNANDYATIRHETEGKWHDWNAKRPPTQYIELGGGPQGQREKPDVWIKPEDSLVIEVKAAQVTASEDYGCGMTLRFPRFRKLRRDRDWQTALSLEEFLDLRNVIEDRQKEKAMNVDEQKKKRRQPNTRKKVITVAGYNAKEINNAALPTGPKGNVFEGLTFYIMTESIPPTEKKSKLELEALVKANGGKIVQTHTTDEHTMCIAARRTVKVASLEKTGKKEIVKPAWIFDCIQQAHQDFAHGLPEMVLPLEPARHLFFVPHDMEDRWTEDVDEYGDSFARDTNVEELRETMDKMANIDAQDDEESSIPELFPDYMDMQGYMFHGLVFLFDLSAASKQDDPSGANGDLEGAADDLNDSTDLMTRNIALFAGAELLPDSDLSAITAKEKHRVTHIVAQPHSDLQSLRRDISRWKARRIPRIMSANWIQECWKAGTKVDEEAYVAR